MTKLVSVQTSIAGARRLRQLIDGTETADLGSLEPAAPLPTGSVVVAAPTELPSEQTEGFTKTRTLRNLNGSTWDDTGQPVPVRVLTNGQQIAWPVGRNGLCVQDTEFWAVNIGTLAPATHPLTGHAEGRAAVLAVKDDGNLEIKADRLDFVRRDTEGGDIEDGTLISLGYVSGTLTIKWADCAPHADLEGLEA